MLKSPSLKRNNIVKSTFSFLLAQQYYACSKITTTLLEIRGLKSLGSLAVVIVIVNKYKINLLNRHLAPSSRESNQTKAESSKTTDPAVLNPNELPKARNNADRRLSTNITNKKNKSKQRSKNEETHITEKHLAQAHDEAKQKLTTTCKYNHNP